MDWANERWVRTYTRDTTTWKVLEWQARTTLLFLFRKVDRVGLLDVGRHGPRGLAAILELPFDLVVKPGIAQLLDEGIVVERGPTYVIPNFLEAQEAKQSPQHRSREYRERRRAKALGEDAPRQLGAGADDDRDEPDDEPPHPVERFEPEREVADSRVTFRDGGAADRHTASHGVTPIQADPIRIQSGPDPIQKPVGESQPRAGARAISPTPTAMPEGWEPDAGGRNHEAASDALERGVVVSHALGKFVAKATAHGWVASDWDARWRAFLLSEFPTAERVREAISNGDRVKNAQAARDRERRELAEQKQRAADPEDLRRAAKAALENNFHPPVEKATG